MVSSTSGMGAICAWSAAQERAVVIASRSQPVPHCPRFAAAPEWEWCEEGFNAQACGASSRSHCRAREEDAGAGQIRGSTRVSRLQVALSSFEDAAEKPALEAALAKAQKQAEEMPWHVRSRSQRSSSRGPRSGCLFADEKIRLAQVALQDAMDEVANPIGPDVGCTDAECGPSPTSKFTPGSRHVEEEGCKTACGSLRAHPTRPARPRVLFDSCEMQSNLEIKSPSSLWWTSSTKGRHSFTCHLPSYANFDLGHRLFLLRPVLLRPGAT